MDSLSSRDIVWWRRPVSPWIVVNTRLKWLQFPIFPFSCFCCCLIKNGNNGKLHRKNQSVDVYELMGHARQSQDYAQDIELLMRVQVFFKSWRRFLIFLLEIGTMSVDDAALILRSRETGGSWNNYLQFLNRFPWILCSWAFSSFFWLLEEYVMQTNI